MKVPQILLPLINFVKRIIHPNNDPNISIVEDKEKKIVIVSDNDNNTKEEKNIDEFIEYAKEVNKIMERSDSIFELDSSAEKKKNEKIFYFSG